MNKWKLSALVVGVLMLGYSAIARYYTGGLRIYSLSIAAGRVLTLSLPYTTCIGAVLFVIGVLPLLAWAKGFRVAHKSASKDTKKVEVTPMPQILTVKPEAEIVIEAVPSETPAMEQAIEDQTIIEPPTGAQVCHSCGATLKESARFCTKCGAKLTIGDNT